jgi:DNA-directed RNA polymerase specialized sigma24 family protein
MSLAPAPPATLVALFTAAAEGNRPALDALFQGLCSELGHGQDTPLGANSLLREAYLDLIERTAPSPTDRARFMAYAARVMRSLLVSERVAGTITEASELPALNAALESLERLEPPLAELVELHLFAGLSFAAIAALHGTTEGAVRRRWSTAQLFLQQRPR